MDDPVFDPSSLLGTLSRNGVLFVVIGGVAAVLHGAPYQTVDCDITPERSAENLARLSAALRELDACVVAGDGVALRFEHDGRAPAATSVWNLQTKHGLLDVAFEPAGTTGYEDLRRNAVVIEVDGAHFPVASLEDVIRSKDTAGREKDRRVLPLLRRMLAEGIELTAQE